jgi:hypothetical protein
MEYAEEDISLVATRVPSIRRLRPQGLLTRLRDQNTCRNLLSTSHAMHSRQRAISLDPRKAAFSFGG